jgi:hypothetical protein
MPTEVRLALLRDALSMLDPRRNPGQRAETAAVLSEALIAEGLKRNAPALIAEAATVAADTIATGPLPAGPRTALVSVLSDAVTLLAAAGDAAAASTPAIRTRRRATR